MSEAILSSPKEWNLPGIGEGRIGGPRVNWVIETAKMAWTKAETYKRVGQGNAQKYNYKNKNHVKKLITDARNELF